MIRRLSLIEAASRLGYPPQDLLLAAAEGEFQPEVRTRKDGYRVVAPNLIREGMQYGCFHLGENIAAPPREGATHNEVIKEAPYRIISQAEEFLVTQLSFREEEILRYGNESKRQPSAGSADSKNRKGHHLRGTASTRTNEAVLKATASFLAGCADPKKRSLMRASKWNASAIAAELVAAPKEHLIPKGVPYDIEKKTIANILTANRDGLPPTL